MESAYKNKHKFIWDSMHTINRMFALAVWMSIQWMSWSKAQNNVSVNRKIVCKSKQLKTINKAFEWVRSYWLLNQFYRLWTRRSPFVWVSPLVVVFRWQQCVELIKSRDCIYFHALSVSATLNVKRTKRIVALHYV